MENIVLVDEVFRTSRDLPMNYISRAHVDDLFVDSLAKQTHIVIHGSSKQGKTSLRKKNLLESDYISITCSNTWGIADINESILKRAGYQITVSESKTLKGTSKVSLSVGLTDTKIGSDISMELARQINRKSLELDNRTKPIVFEYDANRSRVKVVDKSFLLWKQFQELPELLEYIDLEELAAEFV